MKITRSTHTHMAVMELFFHIYFLNCRALSPMLNQALNAGAIKFLVAVCMKKSGGQYFLQNTCPPDLSFNGQRDSVVGCTIHTVSRMMADGLC